MLFGLATWRPAAGSVYDSHMKLGKPFLLASLILQSLWAIADISYRVTPDATRQVLTVEITIPVKGPTVSLQIPNWAPGSYVLSDNFRRIQDLKATTEAGSPIEVQHPNDYTWTLVSGQSGSVRVTYQVASPLMDGAIQYSGPSTYMYVVDRKEEPCRLEVALPADWKIACGLDEDGARNKFKAPGYDVLADNPVSMGNLLIDTYTVRGKPHYIVMRGAAKSDVDRAYLIKVSKLISESQTDFFGNIPYNKYVWHFSVNDALSGGGGLEHLSSTQIGLASAVGPVNVKVNSHEFFHLWNVKRIRSKVLGPFDYTQLPKTGALWWLEGTTDYYAHLLLLRYGWYSEAEFQKDIIANINAIRSNPARLEISPYDASYRVGEAANGRGNSNGYRISYYTLGFLAGLCLDTELRFRTNGRRSLDDVIRALYEQCKDFKPGFEEDGIRAQLVRFGGQSMGEYYDRVIMKAGEMPLEEALAKMGLALAQGAETYVDHGISWSPAKADKGARVRTAAGPAKGNLMSDDLILSINGRSTALSLNRDISKAMQTELEKAKEGQAIALHIKRGDQEMDVAVTPIAATRTVWQITALPKDAAKDRFRMGWYYAGKRKP